MGAIKNPQFKIKIPCTLDFLAFESMRTTNHSCHHRSPCFFCEVIGNP